MLNECFAPLPGGTRKNPPPPCCRIGVPRHDSALASHSGCFFLAGQRYRGGYLQTKRTQQSNLDGIVRMGEWESCDSLLCPHSADVPSPVIVN
jgi:hypothetical protein